MVEQKRVDSVTGGEVEEGEKGMPFGFWVELTVDGGESKDEEKTEQVVVGL